MVLVSSIYQVNAIFFSPGNLMISEFGNSIPSIVSLVSFFIMTMAHFSMRNSIPISWQCIFIFCIRVFGPFQFLANILILSIVIIIPREFFAPALADGLSLDSERQQVSYGLQDSSQYSGRFRNCCCLNGLDSFPDFLLFQFPFETFGNRSKCANNNWYHRLFSLIAKSKYSSLFLFFVLFVFFVFVFCFLWFSLCDPLFSLVIYL